MMNALEIIMVIAQTIFRVYYDILVPYLTRLIIYIAYLLVFQYLGIDKVTQIMFGSVLFFWAMLPYYRAMTRICSQRTL